MISAQRLFCQKSLLLIVLLTSCSTQGTYYVTPTLDIPCPGEPCHTLSQYAIEQYFENFTGDVRMEFLPGNHTLEQTISLANLTQLTLHRDSSFFPEITSRIVISVCDWQTRRGFLFAGITELNISGLAFISGVCGGGLAILESGQKSDIAYSMFQNISLYVYKSILTSLTGNIFQNGKSQVLYAQYSSLKLVGNIFQNNFAWQGATLHVEYSTLNLTGNTFHNNSAGGGEEHFMYTMATSTSQGTHSTTTLLGTDPEEHFM